VDSRNFIPTRRAERFKKVEQNFPDAPDQDLHNGSHERNPQGGGAGVLGIQDALALPQYGEISLD